MSLEAKYLQIWCTENTETNSQTFEHLNSPIAEETFRKKGPVFAIQQKGEKDKIRDIENTDPRTLDEGRSTSERSRLGNRLERI